jgi:hypothetical protein
MEQDKEETIALRDRFISGADAQRASVVREICGGLEAAHRCLQVYRSLQLSAGPLMSGAFMNYVANDAYRKSKE